MVMIWGCNSVGECHIRIVKARGSNPLISTREIFDNVICSSYCKSHFLCARHER